MAKATTVDGYFDALDGPVQEIALALRGRMHALGEGLTIALAWGYPSWSGQERILSIIAHSSRCNLQLFNGAQLASAFAEIEGTGKSLRHVKVHTLADVNARIDDIILAAIALDSSAPHRVR